MIKNSRSEAEEQLGISKAWRYLCFQKFKANYTQYCVEKELPFVEQWQYASVSLYDLNYIPQSREIHIIISLILQIE